MRFQQNHWHLPTKMSLIHASIIYMTMVSKVFIPRKWHWVEVSIKLDHVQKHYARLLRLLLCSTGNKNKILVPSLSQPAQSTLLRHNNEPRSGLPPPPPPHTHIHPNHVPRFTPFPIPPPPPITEVMLLPLLNIKFLFTTLVSTLAQHSAKPQTLHNGLLLY